MNSQLKKLSIALMACYLALFVRLNILQVVDAKEINAKPGNSRKIERDFNRPRGDIVTADGVLVAHSESTKNRFRYQRVYPTDELFAHVVGAYSLMFGSDGVERQYNDELSGNTPEFKLQGFINPFVDEPNVGTVGLTLRADVQRVAKEALGDREGSVVALDPRTGEILALWSFPTYNPNVISVNDPNIARGFKESYNADPEKPLLSRAFRDRFFPGSTFKVVTAAAGLETGKVTEATPNYPPAKGYKPPLTTKTISNFGGSTCGGVLVELLRVSCNSGFAQMGSALIGPDPMISQATEFGFNDTPPLDLPGTAKSVFPSDFGARVRASDVPGDADIYENTPGLAQASIGQGNVSATPLEMALVAGAFGNSGNIMSPHVMDTIRDRNGETVTEFADSVWKQPISVATAEILRRAMIEVVTNGTAKSMAISGYEVGGKTGTAQLGTAEPRSHAWVIGFAGPSGEAAHVAVAVIVEGQPGASEQTGGSVAGPIAKRVMEVALTSVPQPQPAGK